MIRAIADCCRTLIVCWEFAVLLFAACIVLFDPAFAKPIYDVHVSERAMGWICLVPATLLGLTLKEVKEILFPDSDIKKELQKWPDYWKLKLVAYVGIFYGILFTILSALPWIFINKALERQAFVFIATGIVGASICYLSIYNARVKIKEIFINP